MEKEQRTKIWKVSLCHLNPLHSPGPRNSTKIQRNKKVQMQVQAWKIFLVGKDLWLGKTCNWGQTWERTLKKKISSSTEKTTRGKWLFTVTSAIRTGRQQLESKLKEIQHTVSLQTPHYSTSWMPKAHIALKKKDWTEQLGKKAPIKGQKCTNIPPFLVYRNTWLLLKASMFPERKITTSFPRFHTRPGPASGRWTTEGFDLTYSSYAHAIFQKSVLSFLTDNRWIKTTLGFHCWSPSAEVPSPISSFLLYKPLRASADTAVQLGQH